MPGGDIEKTVVLRLTADASSYNPAMQRVVADTDKVGKSVEGLNRQIGDLRGTMGSVAQQFGAGAWGNLLGATTLAAATVAVAAIIAQAMRMAYVFEQTSARVAANMTIGTSTPVGSAYNSIQAAALSPLAIQYGFSHTQALGAMAAYQNAAGATVGPTLAAQRPILSFARATGMEPEDAGTTIGAVSRITQEDARRASHTLYGGAEEAGDLGRDIRGFISTTQSLLVNFAMGAPGRPLSVGRVAQYAADIGAMGGIYSTPQGAQTLAAGMTALTQGNYNNPVRFAIASAAKIPILDILQGTNTPRDQALYAEQIFRMAKGDPREATILFNAYGMGQGDAERMLLNAPPGKRAKWLADMKNNISAPWSADMDKKSADIMGTGYGEVARAVATIDNSLTKMGKGQLDFYAKLLSTHPEIVGAAAMATIEWLPKIFYGILGLDIALGGIKALKGLGVMAEGGALAEVIADAAPVAVGVAAAVGTYEAIKSHPAAYNRAMQWVSNAALAPSRTALWAGQQLGKVGRGLTKIGSIGDKSIYEGATEWGASDLFAHVLSNIPGFNQYPITSLKRQPTASLYADPGHQTGNAVDVGAPENAAGLAYTKKMIATGMFQWVGTRPAWVSQLQEYAKSIGVDPSTIHSDPGTGAHEHFEIYPSVYNAWSAQSATKRETKKVKSSDGSTHSVTITTHVQVTPGPKPAPSPTTSSSRMNSLQR